MVKVNRKNKPFPFEADADVAELIRTIAQRRGMSNKNYLESLVRADAKNYVICVCGELIVDVRTLAVAGLVKLKCPNCGAEKIVGV